MIQTGEAEAGGGQALLILGCVIVVNLDVMVGQRQAAKLDAPSVLLANSKMMKERLPAKHVPRESLLEPLVQQSVQVRDKFVLFCCSFVRFVYWLFFLFFLRDSAHLFLTEHPADCPKGYFQDTTGNRACKECPYGKRGTALALEICENCPAGKYTPSSHVVDGATVTRANAPEKLEECDPCVAGRYADGVGTAETGCKLCDKTTYQDDTGQTSCKACIAGRYVVINTRLALYVLEN